MKKGLRMEHKGKSPFFRMLGRLPAALFLVSVVRGIWYFRYLPDAVPPSLSILWPFSLPLPREFYLLLPLCTGAILFVSMVWSEKKVRTHYLKRDKRPSLEKDPWGRGQGSVESVRSLVSHPQVISFLLQAIVVAFYSFIQERLLTTLTGRPDFSGLLSRFYGWVLVIFLTIFLFSIIIRMYRKDNTLD